MVAEPFTSDIAAVQSIAAVPSILDVVCRTTGMGFAAVARVTEDRWIACQVLDHVNFGLPAGGELKIETTICNEIRDHRQVVAIDNVAEDATYCDHHTPRMYGLLSYISVPIVLSNDTFFGTLCAIDSAPAKVNNPQVIGTFKLFAELIAHHLEANEQLRAAKDDLVDERALSELREQFIAVLGHDLRNPMAALDAGINRLLRKGWDDNSPDMLRLMKASIVRMAGLVDNVMDLARARLGDGITLNMDLDRDLSETLDQVIGEFKTAQPDQVIETTVILPRIGLPVDHARIAQMFSNLLGNALTHGSRTDPVRIIAGISGETLWLDVINRGDAIPSERIATLFRPFHRGNDTSREGLGLGLYIASEIAKAHGGTLTVTSDPEATLFRFEMPVIG